MHLQGAGMCGESMLVYVERKWDCWVKPDSAATAKGACECKGDQPCGLRVQNEPLWALELQNKAAASLPMTAI